MYSCGYVECWAKKLTQVETKKEETFVPKRLLVCGHSVCEICVLNVCKEQKEFIKCTVCAFNTTITDSVQKYVIQYEADIRKWMDPTAAGAQVLRLDMNLFPLDMFHIGKGVDLGVITATKTAETIDLDLDDESVPNHQLSAIQTPINSLSEDDVAVKNIIYRIPKTAPIKFTESVENGVKTFTDLSINHNSIKRTSDETKDWFRKLKTSSREMFHKLHSVLQMREKELLEEMDVIEESRQQDLRVYMNEILSKRSELKGKLLQTSQTQSSKDMIQLKKSIDLLVKNSNLMPINSPQNEFKTLFEPKVETDLKSYGKVEKVSTFVTAENEDLDSIEFMETPVSEPQSEEEVDDEIEEVPNEKTMNREVVHVLQMVTPYKFYVQKESDRERFEFLNEQIKDICQSPYNHPPAIETLPAGERLFAYSSQKKCWCRTTLTLFRHEPNPQTRELMYLADIVLIDYGISETVQWFNVREKKVELFDDKKWPPFAYKCSLYNVRPNRKSASRGSTTDGWTEDAIELFNRYTTNNQLVLYDFETRDGIKFVDLIHYDVPDVTYHIPSLIEALVQNDLAVVSTEIDFLGYNPFKCPPIKYPVPEKTQIMKTLSVLVSHVETPDLFYVQLQRQHSSLLKMIEDLNLCYNSENEGVYTFYCPNVNTPCAALFDGDMKYYRALVIKIQSSKESVVQFVDFGNKAVVKNWNLRLLKNSFFTLPPQAISCGLIHVEPNHGFKWNERAINYFKYAISNDRGPQILTMCVYELKQSRPMVVLRSYDGASDGIKINESLIKENYAISSGQHSLPDSEDKTSSQESLNSIKSSAVVPNPTPIIGSVTALAILKDLMERFELSNANKRSSLIKVMVCSVKSPTDFWVQIDRQEVKVYIEEQELKLHKEYSSEKHKYLGDSNYVTKDLCAFKVGNDWRRGEVISRMYTTDSDAPPEEPRFSVADIDYGSEHEVRASQMRRLSETFKKDGSYGLRCKLHLLRPTGGDEWTQTAKDELKEFVHKFSKDLHILVKDKAEKEPISVILYGRQAKIPGAFDKQKIVYDSINTLYINQGLATFDRIDGSVNSTDDDDDREINTEIVSDQRTQMPFSLFSSTDSILEGLSSRHFNDPNLQTGKPFHYLDEIYPNQPIFYGLPTDITSNTDYNYFISFRHHIEKAVLQPSQVIEKDILDTMNRKGELEPFVGPFTPRNACTAYFEYDKTWNRAEIVGVSGTPIAKLVVRFVDYGNQESILVDKLSSDVFGRETPKLALKCQIINIKPFNKEADTQIRDIIYRKVLDAKCRFCWENFPKLPMKVSLELPVGDQYVPLITILENQNLLATNRIDESDVIEEVMDIHKMVENTYGLYPIVFDSTHFYEVVVSHPLINDYVFFQAVEVKRPTGQDCIINEQHDSFLLMLENMRAEVNGYSRCVDFSEGTACLALYSDNCWYRGLILTACADKKVADIFFVDYGNTDEVAFAKLKEIPKKQMRPKAHSMFCQLFNVKPANNQLWSKSIDLNESISNHLMNMCSERKVFAKFKLMNEQNREYPLKIDLYFGAEDDETVPDRHVFQEFVDRGLLEFADSRDVWRKPIREEESYRNRKIKSERID